jgi:hypothetical protein
VKNSEKIVITKMEEEERGLRPCIQKKWIK